VQVDGHTPVCFVSNPKGIEFKDASLGTEFTLNPYRFAGSADGVINVYPFLEFVRQDLPQGLAEHPLQTGLRSEGRIDFNIAKIQRIAFNFFDDAKAFVDGFKAHAVVVFTFAQLFDHQARLDRLLPQAERSPALLKRRIQGFRRPKGRRGKAAQTCQLPQVFGVERAARIVGNNPDRADRLAFHVKRKHQALFSQRHHRQQIGVPPFKVLEQQRRIAVEHVTARAEIARRGATGMRLPNTGNSGQVEALFILCQQADACGACLKGLQKGLGQCLKNGGG